MEDDPIGHQKRSAVHQRALTAGAKVKTIKTVDGETTLLEYDRADGTYAYFKSVRGAHKIDLPFDEAVAAWPDDTIDLPMERVQEIELQ